MVTTEIDQALNSPTVSYWLKETMLTALRRDPVRAAEDADMLSLLLKSRAEAMLRGDPENRSYNPPGPMSE